MPHPPQSGARSLEGELDGPDARLGVGTAACVWNHFLRRWTGGFAVAEVLANGYRLRRLSDGQVFPDVFRTDEVMAERRKIQEPGFHGTHRDRRATDSAE